METRFSRRPRRAFFSFSITGLQPALPLIRQGRVKALAFGGRERSPTLPEVPTMSESGLQS